MTEEELERLAEQLANSIGCWLMLAGAPNKLAGTIKPKIQPWILNALREVQNRERMN